VIAALLDLIPNVGATIAGVLAFGRSVSSGRSSACRSRPHPKIVAKELTAARRARVAAADAAEQQQPA
jgi:hypothetical protein